MRFQHHRVLAPFALVCSLAVASIASAHISLERGGTHMSRYGEAEIKDAPCGRLNGARGENVYTYTPGETITITFDEFVPHPGYFRIAFDNDGDDDFADPASIMPISRACLGDGVDQCGESDFYNNDTVLMDNLDPHDSGGGLRTYQVTLPDVECDNCTLQIIQVMEDAIHGPYNPSNSGVSELFYVEDVYHTCIDLVLAGDGAPTAGDGAPTAGTGGSDMAAGGSGAAGSAGIDAAGSGGEAMASGGAGGDTVAGGSPEPVAGAAGDPVGVGNRPAAGMGGLGGSAAGTTPAPAASAGAAAEAAGSTGGGSSSGCAVVSRAAASQATPLLLGVVPLWFAGRRRRLGAQRAGGPRTANPPG